MLNVNSDRITQTAVTCSTERDLCGGNKERLAAGLIMSDNMAINSETKEDVGMNWPEVKHGQTLDVTWPRRAIECAKAACGFCAQSLLCGFFLSHPSDTEHRILVRVNGG